MIGAQDGGVSLERAPTLARTLFQGVRAFLAALRTDGADQIEEFRAGFVSALMTEIREVRELAPKDRVLVAFVCHATLAILEVPPPQPLTPDEAAGVGRGFAAALVDGAKNYASTFLTAALESPDGPDAMAKIVLRYVGGELPEMPRGRRDALSGLCVALLAEIVKQDASRPPEPADRLVFAVELPRSLLLAPTSQIYDVVARKLEPALAAARGPGRSACNPATVDCGCTQADMEAGRCLLYAPDGSERVP